MSSFWGEAVETVEKFLYQAEQASLRRPCTMLLQILL
jgi:hypothetical protein